MLWAPSVLGQGTARVVVVGGGFGGGACARALRRHGLAVTLVEPEERFTACPFSNEVIAGLRDLDAQRFGYDGLRRDGVEVVHRRAMAVDAAARRVRLDDGTELAYDRLVLAPGIELRFDALPGYDQAAAEAMPHAWKAGAQTLLLRRQLEAMPDGGVVAIAAPANPFRCPPGPYERASLIAHYLKTRKPRSKLIVLDAKDAFSKQRLFQAAWDTLYPGLLEWVPLSSGGRVTEVDAATKTLVTEFGSHRADVANIIPPQRAGAIAQAASVADQTGWCPIDPVTFESRLQPGIHVIGDAAIAGAMPKSAFAANGQAQVCAAAVAGLLHGETPAEQKLVNTCYSLVAPGYGISVAGVYRPADGLLREVEGAGGTSPLDASPEFREMEARYAEAWFGTITGAVFG
ncbi:NAD(P)/FAD-dependent oxidoreductase [Mycobacterium sp. KBS0706]|uniref:NAD(P)/FAD-dependent oxidoreductase n=1 Tax=Mycobacterium sp. KBS0706 TaxID=2578109 RepID=UPI001C8F9C8A|nr:NAD(P)/FAD-dependent oxidoreductase [Mycobacterium sp. KBS0706]